MTRERAKELLPVIGAWLDRKAIQVKVLDRVIDTVWQDYIGDNADFYNENWQWRIKPESKWRAFTQGEAMKFRWFRKGMDDSHTYMVVETDLESILLFSHFRMSYEKLFYCDWLCSVDGVTWQRCGVEE